MKLFPVLRKIFRKRIPARIMGRCNTRYFLILLCSLFSMQAWATDYYAQSEIGWHWYHEPPPQKTSQQQTITNPQAQMTVMQQNLKNALDTALLSPTVQHVKNYISLQNAWSNQASTFARIWQIVLLQNPQLDYSLTHPTNQLGREVYLDQQTLAENAAIHALAQHSGLFLFYRSSCPYCQRFAPIIKNFAQRYGISLIPITTDGIALPEFPHSRVDNGQAASFHVTMEPALFTVDPYTHKAIPVSYGLTTEDELKQRILDIAQHPAEYEQ